MKSQSKWVVARLQLTMLSRNNDLITRNLFKRKVNAPEKQPPNDGHIIKFTVSQSPTKNQAA